MSHETQLEFVNTVATSFPEKFSGRYLEIGGEDINGNLRGVIKCSEYVGVD